MAGESKGTVLVVDDEQQLADLYTEFLKNAGYEVRTAYNGGQAIIELDRDVDVVLLDRQMPGMQGEEVLHEIREWLDWCRVVMVTATEPDFDVANLPFDEYLNKPVDEAELTETVTQMFLLDEYDDLLNEFRSVTKRYVTLKSHKPAEELDNSEEFRELEDRREEILDRLPSLISEFSDPEFRNAFEAIHSLELLEDGETDG